jgi:hypothetical protein
MIDCIDIHVVFKRIYLNFPLMRIHNLNPKLANISKASDCSTERRKARREGREVAIIGKAYPNINKVFSSLPLLFREINIILMSILLALPSEPEFVNF